MHRNYMVSVHAANLTNSTSAVTCSQQLANSWPTSRQRPTHKL